MSYEPKDWIVRVYDKNDKVIEAWVIENRTESQASREAESDVAKNIDAEDWSMVEVDNKWEKRWYLLRDFISSGNDGKEILEYMDDLESEE